MNMLTNLNSMSGFGQDANGNDKISVEVRTCLYSKCDGTGNRRKVCGYPDKIAQAAREGRLEDYLNRSDFIVSTEIHNNFGNMTPRDVVIYGGT